MTELRKGATVSLTGWAVMWPVCARRQRVDDGFNDPLRQGPPRVDALNDWRILHRTGPHVWTDSVLQLMHNASIGWHEALVPGGWVCLCQASGA